VANAPWTGVSGKEVKHDMAKTTRKTEPTTGEQKPAARRAKAAPAAGVEKATARRRTKTAADAAAGGQPNGQGAAQEPTHDEIALRAWSIYLERGASHGQAMSDWLEAKRQLFAERKLAE